MASGPLTRAAYTSAGSSYIAAAAPFVAAVKARSVRAIAATAPKEVTALHNFIAQLSALTPPSAAATTAQQNYISALKQQAALTEQLGKAASTNDVAAAKAVAAMFGTVQANLRAAGRELAAALP
jgi:hypothetical protein